MFQNFSITAPDGIALPISFLRRVWRRICPRKAKGPQPLPSARYRDYANDLHLPAARRSMSLCSQGTDPRHVHLEKPAAQPDRQSHHRLNTGQGSAGLSCGQDRPCGEVSLPQAALLSRRQIAVLKGETDEVRRFVEGTMAETRVRHGNFHPKN